MMLQPLALILVIHAFHPRVDFPAGKKRCLKMCQNGCTKDPSEKQSSCVKLADPRGPPWINPLASPDNSAFKYKWCRSKFQMISAAVQPTNEGLLYATKYPKTGLDAGEFAEVDHVDWITPKCNITTAPSCKSIKPVPVDEKLKWWLIDEAEACRTLANEQICTEDCTKFCLDSCECGWGKDAVVAYEAGHFQRYRYEDFSEKGECVKAYKFDKKCTCSNGEAADSATCLFHSKEQCAACFHGYTLDSNAMRCITTQCNCLYGTPVNSTTCSKHGTHECETCNGNYHLGGFNGKICTANKCVCENGDPVDSTGCETNGTNVCARCNKFFHRVTDQGLPRCDANKCVCKNGDPVESTACKSNGTNVCTRCNKFFHRVTDQGLPRCDANKCVCENGDPVSSTDCKTNGTNVCARCNKFFHRAMDQGLYRCHANKCICENGDPVDSTACRTNGTNVCARCNKFFHRVTDQGLPRCETNKCVCENGDPVDSASCETNGTNVCARCNKFFHRVTDQGLPRCAANKCVCENGDPVDSTECKTNGANVCARCNRFFHGVMDQGLRRCDANKCVCKNGEPVNSTRCETNGTNVCARCNNFFHRVTDQGLPQCDENVCKCSNGTPVTNANCSLHGTIECAVCKDYYHRTSAKTCKAQKRQYPRKMIARFAFDIKNGFSTSSIADHTERAKKITCDALREMLIHAKYCEATLPVQRQSRTRSTFALNVKLEFASKDILDAHERANQIIDDIRDEVGRRLGDAVSVVQADPFEVKKIFANKVRLALKRQRSAAGFLEALSQKIEGCSSESLRNMIIAETITLCEVEEVVSDSYDDDILVLRASITFGSSALLTDELFNVEKAIAQMIAEDASPDIIDDFYPVVCNDTRIGGVRFNKQRPIETMIGCEDLANELKKRFRLLTDKVPDRVFKETEQRCYMDDDDAFVFGEPGHRSASTFSCEKMVQKKCETVSTTLCTGKVNSKHPVHWTPFEKVDSKTSSAQIARIMRRTCKTEYCRREIDKHWCCDQRLGSGLSLREDEIEYLHKSKIGHGYHTSADEHKSRVFHLYRDGHYINGLEITSKQTCNEFTLLVDISSYDSGSFRHNRQSEFESTKSIEVGIDAAFFKASMSHQSAVKKSRNEEQFIAQATSKSFRVIELRSDCVSIEVTSRQEGRPVFTEHFINYLAIVQRATLKSESEQVSAFKGFVNAFGLEVLRGAQFGSLLREYSTEKSFEVEKMKDKAIKKCKEKAKGTQVSISATKNNVTGSLGGGSTKRDKNCADREIHTMLKNKKHEERGGKRTVGSCKCEEGASNAGDVLINMKLQPIISMLQPKWLTISIWFRVFINLNVKTILQFFKRWIWLDFGLETCFIRDYKLFKEYNHENARRECYEDADPTKCRLQMCNGGMANTRRINKVCRGDACKEFCCLPVKFGERCASRKTYLDPYPCEGSLTCLHVSSQKPCSKEDTFGCECQACPHMPASRHQIIMCMDGTECDFGASTSCCNFHGGRMKCPAAYPFMCANTDCAGNDYCCGTSINSCKQSGNDLLKQCPVGVCGTMSILGLDNVSISFGKHHALPPEYKDKISKLQVYSGYSVAFFERRAFQGKVIRFSSGEHQMQQEWRRARSYECQREYTNECICENGTPVPSSRCTEHLANQCDFCDFGYHMKYMDSAHQTSWGVPCEANRCFCIHGTPVHSTRCRNHLGNQCAFCNSHFLLQPDASCKCFGTLVVMQDLFVSTNQDGRLEYSLVDRVTCLT